MNRCWISLGNLTGLSALAVVAVVLCPSLAKADEAEDTRRLEAARAEMYDSLSREVSALERQSNALKMVVKLVRPTVVHIEAEKIEPASVHYGRGEHVEEAGSGCLIKIKGRDYVLTNCHVIKSASTKSIKIRLADGRQIHPTTAPWTDPETDVAVMAVDAPGLISAKVGNSADVEIGDFVLAVGSPFGLSHSITFGIVSATGRWDLKLGEGVKYQDFIQTDAAINPGNSGGPLINLRGEVIGMNTAIASNSGGNEGIGFSIPINMVMVIARQLVERSSVVRAFLGVQLDGSFDRGGAVSVGLSRTRGARVKDVNPNSPAEVAQLKPGDVILEYDGVRVDSDSHLINLVNLTEVDRVVPMLVVRDGHTMKMTIKAASRPSSEAAVTPAAGRDK